MPFHIANFCSSCVRIVRGGFIARQHLLANEFLRTGGLFKPFDADRLAIT
jgi:hypothetical protein